MSDFINNAHDFVAHRQNRNSELFDKSPYWPEVYSEENPYFNPNFPGAEELTEITFSSIVRKEFEGKWYAIHVLDTYTLSEKGTALYYLNFFHKKAYLTLNFFLVSNKSPLDQIQMSESERLMNSDPSLLFSKKAKEQYEDKPESSTPFDEPNAFNPDKTK